MADLRPLVQPTAWPAIPTTCAQRMLLEEAGGVVTDPWGEPLAVPLDNVSPSPGWATPTRRWRPGSAQCWPSWWTVCVRGSAPGPPRPPRWCGRLLGGARARDADPAGHARSRPDPTTPSSSGPAVALAGGAANDLARFSYEEIRRQLAAFPRWTHYVIGVAVVLVRHGVIDPPRVRLEITSDLPASVGVASSAALEVATARALGGAAVDPLRLAALCQEAENHVVGAPCGIMDQVAVALGTPGTVLPILCRPASAAAPVAVPSGIEIVGWPTGAAARCQRRCPTGGPGPPPSWASGWWRRRRDARGPG